MIREQGSLRSSYFEEKYRQDIDPWNFRTSAYEREKYLATLAALTRNRYDAALEVGCSIGVLTQMLSPFCKHLLALDASPTAIEAARLANISNVDFRVAFLPDQFPQGTFNLIILSEVLYYFDREDLERMTSLCQAGLAKGGEIILCHWLGETNYPLAGHDASDAFVAGIKMPVRDILHNETYRLERLTFGPP